MAEFAQQALHQFVPTRINVAQVAHFGKTVGQVATPASRHFHLGKHTRRTLYQHHPSLRQKPFQPAGKKKTCGTAAHNCYLHCLLLIVAHPDRRDEVEWHS